MTESILGLTDAQDLAFQTLNDFYGNVLIARPQNPHDDTRLLGAVILTATDEDNSTVCAVWIVAGDGELIDHRLDDRLVAGYTGRLLERQGPAFPTSAQIDALRRLMAQHPENGVHITPRPFDLPDDYLGVLFQPDRFSCGIAPDGSVSS